jgi:site-specific recombinase
LQFLRARTVEDRMDAFAELGRRMLAPMREREFELRLSRWVKFLEEKPRLRQRVRRAFAEMLAGIEPTPFLAETGLPAHHALLHEGVRRVLQRLLPSVRPQKDLTRLVLLLFRSPLEVERFVRLTETQFAELDDAFWKEDPKTAGADGFQRLRAGANLRRGAEEALRLLATRVAGRGLTGGVRERGSGGQVEQSPFYRLLLETAALPEALRRTGGSRDSFDRWNALVEQCRTEMAEVRIHMETAGVSSDLVFDLRTLDLALQRMCSLADVLASTPGAPRVQAVRRLLDTLVTAQYRETRVSSLLRENMNLLARKTVERTGRGGEHYIAHSRAEYWQMWRAAIGGGLLTVITAAIKMRVASQHFPLFVEGFLIGTNYAVSFLLLQVFGFVLATKQPSMTGATFAGIVRRYRGSAREREIAGFVAAITRSQLAAALGNVLAVVLGAVAFERLWQRLFYVSYLPVSTARHVYTTLHPFTSGTAFFAILTGVILWLAAMIGGWFENFAVYHRMMEAIRQHPAGEWLGRRRLLHFADVLERDLGGWSTSIALGYLLGFVPVIGSFFGVNLDVRHVTLTTGTLALAAARFGTRWFGHDWFNWAVAGIGITFVLNLSVSFSIAAYVALRAYDVSRREQWQLLKYVAREIVRSPLKFILPVGGSEESARLAEALSEESAPEPRNI